MAIQSEKHNMIKWETSRLLIILIIIMMILFFNFIFMKLDGITLLGGDDCSKILIGWRCRDNLKCALYNDMWLPLHTWILALGLKFFPNTLAISPIINTIFFTGSLIVIFFITHELFNRFIPISILTMLLVAFHPFFVRFSLSGLEVTIFHFFILMGIYSWIKYTNCKKIIFLFLSSIAFLLSTATRYEGWIFTLIYSFLILKAFIDTKRSHKYYLLGSLIVSYLFIFFWFFWQKVHFGNMFFFIIRQYNTGINEASYLNKLELSSFRVPIEVLRSTFWFFSWPFIIFFIVGLWFAIKSFKNNKQIFDFLIFIIISFIILTVLISFRLGGSWYEKQYAIILLLLLPVCSLGIWRSTILQFKNRKLGIIFFMIVVVLIFNGYNKRNFYFRVPEDSYYSRKVAALLRSLQLQYNSKVLLEARTFSDTKKTYLWDSFFILVTEPDLVVPDRKMEYIIKEPQEYLDTNNNPSVFKLPSEKLKDYMNSNSIKIALCIYDDTRKKLDKIMRESIAIGPFSIYTWPNDKYLMGKIKVYSEKLKIL